MTDILCNWLNNEVKLSRKIDSVNFAREFSTGYLIGELFHKHQLQDDFDQFSQNRSTHSKLINFTKVEPTLHLLEVPFDTNVARDIMTEKHGIATRLIYQIFISLNRKQKANLSGIAMETMRPQAPVKLEGVESQIYKERLKHMTPRQSDLNLEAAMQKFHQKQIDLEKTAFKERFEEEEKQQEQRTQHRLLLLSKYKENVASKSDMLAKIQAANVNIPKPPPDRTVQAIKKRKQARDQKEAEDMRTEIYMFEEKMKRTLPPTKQQSETDVVEEDYIGKAPTDPLTYISPASNDQYINKIKKRLNEDASARSEREKRRRKVLVDQMTSHQAQEESRREEMLVNRLMRQSQQERRIAVQLLQARHEKAVIRDNRLIRERQIEEKRLNEFLEALNREAEMARLAKIDYAEQTAKDQELHDRIMAERAEERYRKHYQMCGEVLSDIVDFAVNIGDYRKLTNNLLPPKLMRDWTALFVEGKPLSAETSDEISQELLEPTPEQILEKERQELLAEVDFNEYRNMVGEWIPPEENNNIQAPASNPIVGHIVQRLFNIVHPPSPPPTAPEFPPFPIKACILGKVFSGKTTCVRNLAQHHRMEVLNVEVLVTEAIEANKDGEVVEIEEEEITIEVTGDSNTAVAPDTITTTPSQAQLTDSGEAQNVLDNKSIEELQQRTTEKDDGQEKMDSEKPVAADKEDGSTRETSDAVFDDVTSLKPTTKPSVRAELGGKAMKLLKKGKPVDDQLLVDVLIDVIKRIPEGTGWVLDGFPATYHQAKLLEKALSGFGPEPTQEESKPSAKESKGRLRKSVLAPDPRPAPPPREPSSGINVVILFDVPDDICLKRSAGRSYGPQSSETYHQEFNPPPEGSATGIGKQEKVLPVDDPQHDMEQLQHRLTTFQDTWPKMEKWFSRFGSLVKLDALQPPETTYDEVERILEEVVKKLQGGDEKEPETEEMKETILPEEPKTPEPEKVPEPVVATPVEDKDRSRPPSKKGSRTGSAKRSGSRGSADKKGREKSKSPSKDGGKKSPKSSRGSSGKSPKRGKSGKKRQTPEPEPEPEPAVVEPEGPPPPKPGSDEWEYVDLPFDETVAHILTPQWESLEISYIDSAKLVFNKLRDERERIIQYFYKSREDYLGYLRRPDHKQEFLIQWQKEFNDVEDDIRDDEETRAELHERVDDLRDRLWSICDERKEQAEKERENVINDGWLDDHMGLLTNQYITLMQAEVDRFQDTVRLLKDYYRAMDGKIPDELKEDFIRLPLVELPPMGSADDGDAGSNVAASPTNQQSSVTTTVVPSTEEVTHKEVTQKSPSKSPSKSRSRTPSARSRKKKSVSELSGDASPIIPVASVSNTVPEQTRQRIPLIPRRPTSADAAAAVGAKGKVDKGKSGKGKEGTEELPPPPEDPDEKLLYDSYWTGAMAVNKILVAEQVAKELEEEAEKEREKERELEAKQKQAAAQKGKKGKGGKKSRSPSPKKGGKRDKTPPRATPTPPQPEETSEEEKEKKRIKDNARLEYFAAMQNELVAAKTRMDLVRCVGAAVMQNLRGKAEVCYTDMNDWLGARFLKEMKSIDMLSEVTRYAIENGSQIKEELKLEQEEFIINLDSKVQKTPSPLPPPAPVEPVLADVFTVDQIMNIYGQFKMTAPSGILSLKAFQDIFQDLASLTHGAEQMPDAWINLSPDKIEHLSEQLSADGEFIDWRAFLLTVANVKPEPSQTDLLLTLNNFKDMDQQNTGFVSREQFAQTQLWFEVDKHSELEEGLESELFSYNRLANLKQSLFEIFADHTSEPAKLNYVDMLLYASVSSDPHEGYLRALSVAAGDHMPHTAKEEKKTSRSPSRQSLTASVELDGDKEAEAVAPPTEYIPESAKDAMVPLEALYKVLHHGKSLQGDSHRFSVSVDPEDAFSWERLSGIYGDLGAQESEPLPFLVIMEHPVIQDMVASCKTFKTVDLKPFVAAAGSDNLDAQSQKTTE